MFACFSLRDKYFSQKPVQIALVYCCLKRAFIWKLGKLWFPRSYRRFKPSELSVLACRAQAAQPWQTLSPAKILNANLSLGTFDLQTSKTHTERVTNPNKVYQRLFMHLLFTFSPSLHNGSAEDACNISCTCESKKLIKYHWTTACHNHSSWKKSR